MKLLDISTMLEKEKVTTRVEAKNYNNKIIYGYEIHMGISKLGENVDNLFNIIKENGGPCGLF